MTPPSIQLPMLENPHGIERQLGSLIMQGSEQRLALPLGSVDIQARVAGRVAEVTVKQVFRNNLKEHMEAVYIFPLAAGSAISSFNMKVGDRVIKGLVQERAEARRQYQQALVVGKRAALMEQERDDVFTVQVGNLPPGEEVTIEIVYSERLPFFENGASELRLPLVVAPRYTPGVGLERDNVGCGIEHDTDLVPDASRISPPRLARGVDPQTALKLKVEILPEDGAEISDLACSQHASKASLQQGGITVSLARADERLNRDFVLRWRSASDTVKTTLLTYKAEDGQTYGVLSVLPPRRNGYLGAARDIIFVLDRSGSMGGLKMSSAASACSILLNTLGPQDRFAIAAFDNTVEWMPSRSGRYFTEADTAGVEAGERYLRTVTARGGTEMDNALCHAFSALGSRDDKTGRVPSLVVLTDGEVGNESQILRRIQTEIGDARLFVVGIDTAVNSGLLKRLANLGGGTATFVEPGIQLEEALASIGREIGAPLVTDLRVENLDLSVDQASLSPHRIPDIFAGRASVSFFKLSGKDKQKGKLRLKGKLANGKKYEEIVSAQRVEMPCIAQLWAKTHIMDLEDEYRVNPNAKSNVKKQIIDLSIKHSVLTRFTAFVVVDEAEIVNKTGDIQKVVQPVEMPDAWEMTDALMATGSMKCMKVSADAGVRARSISRPMMDMAAGGFAPAAPAAGSSQAGNDAWGAAPAEADQWSAQQAWGDPGRADAWGASVAKEFEANDAGWSSAAPQPAMQQSPIPPQYAPSQSPVPQPGSAPPVPAPAPKPASEPPAHSAPAAQPAPAEKAEAALSAETEGFSFEDLAQAKKDSADQPKRQIKARSIGPDEAETVANFHRAMKDAASDLKAGGPLAKLQSIFEKLGNLGKVTLDKKLSPELGADVARVQTVLINFLKLFGNGHALVHLGKMPDAELLETARLQLLQTLAVLKLGMELPKTQRFLRANAIELVSSLRDTSLSNDERKQFWDEKEEIFNDVKDEIDALLSGREAAFWDSSV